MSETALSVGPGFSTFSAHGIPVYPGRLGCPGRPYAFALIALRAAFPPLLKPQPDFRILITYWRCGFEPPPFPSRQRSRVDPLRAPTSQTALSHPTHSRQ